MRILRPLAEQGNASAQYNLGVMYYVGQGVKQDYAKALAWYRKAAEQGNAGAQYDLGMMFHEGQGVSPDDVLAYKWIDLAASHLTADQAGKYDQIIKDRDKIATYMSSTQIAEAQQLADEWKPKK